MKQIFNYRIHSKIFYNQQTNINFIHLSWMIESKNIKKYINDIMNYLKRILK